METKVISVKEFNPETLGAYGVLARPRGSSRNDEKVDYLDCVMSFDIETSTINNPDFEDYDKKAVENWEKKKAAAEKKGREFRERKPRPHKVNFMYVWQFCINGDVVILGRTWDEFRDFMKKLSEWKQGKRAVIYVHNLSYEWQYIHNVLDFESHFASDTRKVLRALTTDGFEFRCSMMLSNMSLEQFTNAMKVEHVKRTDTAKETDLYNRVYYPDTKLPPEVLGYCINDVLGLVEAVKVRMALDGDTLLTVPMTSTGYPRRDVKAAMANYSHEKLERMQPTPEIYLMLEEAFRGGNTHASRYNANCLFKAENGDRVLSFDRSSSYPDVLCNCEFPMTPFKKEEPTVERLGALMKKKKKAILVELECTNCSLKNEYNPVPYLSISKLKVKLEDGKERELRDSDDIETDNGRLLKSNPGLVFYMIVTDIDLRIIQKQYKMKVNVVRMFSSDYAPLPSVLTETIIRYYTAKTALKGVPEKDLEYNKAKALLNAIYGMLVQKLSRDPVYYDYELGEWSKGERDIEDDIERYKRKAYSCYQWGVWCTALARARLQLGIDLVEGDLTTDYLGNDLKDVKGQGRSGNFVYCDTDSVKYLEDERISWNDLNDRLKAASIKSGAYADDPKGERHFMGVYENDAPEGYMAFKTLGSKRYVYISLDDIKDKDGKKTGEKKPCLHITISGVSKKAGAEELGDIENFKDGFVFNNSGKTASYYYDNPEENWMIVDNHGFEITPYIVIEDTTYKLGLSDSYEQLLNAIANAK